MPSIRTYLLASLIVGACVLSGCAHRGRCCAPVCDAMLPPVEELLPKARRGSLVPDTSAVDAMPPPGPSYRYHALTAMECQCLAVQSSALGNLLAAERRSIRSASGDKMSRSDCLRISILEAAEHEARNQNAAAALELYYKIAEGEALLAVADRSQAEIIDALAKTKQLRTRGVEIPFDATEFERQWVKIESDRTAGERQLTEANHQLLRLLGLEALNDDTRIWPDDKLRVNPEVLDDENVEVARGLASRPEIAALYQLSCSLDAETLDVARAVLGRVDGLLGMHGDLSCMSLVRVCTALHNAPCEASSRRSQLASHANRLEQEISDSIRQRVDELEIRLREVALAKDLVARWDIRLRELAKLQKVERSSFVEITKARLERLDAEASLVRAAVGWKIALVKLREQQGVLPLECSECGPEMIGHHVSEPVAEPPRREYDTSMPIIPELLPAEPAEQPPMQRPELELPRPLPRHAEPTDVPVSPAEVTPMSFAEPATLTPPPARPIQSPFRRQKTSQSTTLFQPPPLAEHGE